MNDHSNNPFPAVTEGAIGDSVVQTVNARDLHAFLGVGRDFSNWVKDRIAAYAFNEHSDFEIFEDLSSPNLVSAKSRAQTTKEYALTLDMAKELAMVERNEKGKQVRRYFIECERKAKDAARAKAEIDFSDPIILLGTFKHLQGQVERANAKIAVLQPQADALSRIAIADGSLCVTDAAKTLQMRPSDLFKWLQTHDWIYGRVGNSHHIGYQAKIAAGYLEHKVTSVYRSDGSEKTVTQVRVTPKGLAKLGELLATKPPEGKSPPQPGTLFNLVIAGMMALGLIGQPDPAKALPTRPRDGLAVFHVNGRPITVDTQRFDVGPNERVLCLHGDGRIDFALLRLPAERQGRRSFWEANRAPRSGEDMMAMSTSGIVHVLGAIVDP